MINRGLPNESLWIESFVKSKRFDEVVQAVREMPSNTIVTFFDKDSGNRISGERKSTPRFDSLRGGDIDLQPLYILDYITSKSDGVIYDIGCGYNFFKKFYNVIGIDPDSDQADIHRSYDLSMAAENMGKMDNVFSINAIHFCHPDELGQRVQAFFDMVKPGGYAYLAVNVARVFQDLLDFDRLPEDQRNKNVKVLSKYAKANVLDICRDEVIYWKDTIANKFDSYMNGNVKILIRKT
jgi:SAM-dependent methyltransferase